MDEYIVGIDVGGTNVKIMIMSTDLFVIGFSSIKTNSNLGYDIISDNIILEINSIFETNNILNPKVLSVAMGLPGTVYKREQKTGFLSVLMWNNCNPCEKIGKYFNAKYCIENDANLNALGEYFFGIEKIVEDVVLLTLGTGVGCGIIANGEIFGGANNQAAEIGHMTIVVDGGEKCLCGKYGHLEAYCSGTAMKNYALEKLHGFPNSLLHKYIAEAGEYDNSMIDKGVTNCDEFCEIVFNRFTKFLSVGIANAMKLFNPSLVILAGGISNAGELLLKPLKDLVRGNLMDSGQECPIVQSVLGSKAGVYGACALASEQL